MGIAVKVREDDAIVFGLSVDKEPYINCGVSVVFDIIEFRQRGIVVTFANDIDESVKLFGGDDGRSVLTVV